MRVLVILVIIALAIFGFQSQYYRGQSSERLAASTQAAIQDPRAAYDKIKPVFAYSPVTTFGKAQSDGMAFFQRMEEAYTARLQSAGALEPEFFVNLADACYVITTAAKEQQIDLDKHVIAILETTHAQLRHMGDTLSLPSWDRMVVSVERIHKEKYFPESYRSDFERWLPELQTAGDRRTIALRDALAAGQTALVSSLKTLGVQPGDSLFAPLPRPVDSEKLKAADEQLAAGEEAGRRMMLMFKEGELPGELRPIWSKLTYNHAAMRVAHLQDRGRDLTQRASPYLVRLYIHPNATAIPTDAELYGSFINAVGEQLKLAVRSFETPGAVPSDQAGALQAMGYRAISQYYDAIFQPPGAGQMRAAFDNALQRPEMPDASRRELRQLAESGDVFLVTR